MGIAVQVLGGDNVISGIKKITKRTDGSHSTSESRACLQLGNLQSILV